VETHTGITHLNRLQHEWKPLVRKGEEKADLAMNRGEAEERKRNERKGRKEEGEGLARIRRGDQGWGACLHGPCRRL
jgi:hypothetical protein